MGYRQKAEDVKPDEILSYTTETSDTEVSIHTESDSSDDDEGWVEPSI
jgi:hypothetical protein